MLAFAHSRHQGHGARTHDSTTRAQTLDGADRGCIMRAVSIQMHGARSFANRAQEASWAIGMDPELTKCKTAKEFIRYAIRAGAEISTSGKGSHKSVVYQGRVVQKITQPGNNRQYPGSACKEIMQSFHRAGLRTK